MTTKKATAEQPAPATDPIARVIERALHNPTAIQLQFQAWMVEQAEAHGMTFKSDREREAFRVAVVIGSRSYPTFQAVKNGRVAAAADADLAALVAATAPEAPARSAPARKAPSQRATRKANPAKAAS